MSRHEELIAAAKNAINEAFSDRSVPAGKTLGSMKELKEEIQGLIDALEDDGVTEDGD